MKPQAKVKGRANVAPVAVSQETVPAVNTAPQLGNGELIPFCLVCVSIVVLSILRRPGAFTYPTLYYEDGSAFYRDQLVAPGLSTLFRPFYAGYYLLVPRLVALVASVLPARHAPLLFNGTGVLVAALSCSTVCLRRFRSLIRSDAMRIVLAFLFAVALDSQEILASAANCFWPLGIAGLLFSAFPPGEAGSSILRRTALAAGGLLLALSTPLIVLSAPFAATQAIRRRSSRYFTLAVLVGAGVQMAIHLASDARAETVPKLGASGAAILVATAQRVILSSVLGFHTALAASEADVIALPLAALMILSATITWLLACAPGARCKTACVLFVLFASELLSLEGKNFWMMFQGVGRGVLFGGQRYFFIGSCALAVLAAIAVEELLGKLRPKRSRVPVEPFLGAFLVLGIFSYAAATNFSVESGTQFNWDSQAPLIDKWERAYKERARS